MRSAFPSFLLGTVAQWSKLYLAPRFDPVAMLTSLERTGLTVVLGAPSMFSLLLEYAKLKGFESLRFPALRIIASAALRSTSHSIGPWKTSSAWSHTVSTELLPTWHKRGGRLRMDNRRLPVFPGIEVQVGRS